MQVFRQQQVLKQYLDKERLSGKSIGFVPTMGALHVGHASLIELSKKTCDITVCSIFVNPTQFNDPKDLEKYPRNEAKDTELLERVGGDILYIPDAKDVYPDGTNDLVEIDLKPLDTILEGKSRPGHFKGVVNVVKRLLDIVNPDVMFLGQKDYQQVMVIKRMIDLSQRDPFGSGINVKVVTGDIVREANGLAMSSRNERLDSLHRSEAGKIYQALKQIKSSFRKLSWVEAHAQAVDIIETIPDSKLDYLMICDVNTLQPLDSWDNVHLRKESASGGQVVCLVAVNVNGVRLIDNIILTRN